MIILPQIAQNKATDKPGSPDIPGSDSEGLTEDFLLLVRNAKVGTVADSEDAPLLTGAALRKTNIKNDSLKLAADLTSGRAAQPRDALAALLAPQMKETAATKALFATDDKADTDKDADLQAISALFAMLPHSASAQNLVPAITGKTSGSDSKSAPGLELTDSRIPGLEIADSEASEPATNTRKAPDLAVTSNRHALATQTDKTMHHVHATDTAVEHISLADDKMNMRFADNYAASANTQTFLNPAISSSAPVLSSGTQLAVPTTPILNAQLGSQEWQQQLSQQIMLFTRQGQQQAELRLHPEHLGKVEISLKLDDNQLQLQIMSPHSHVRAALEAALPLLRTSLNESGLQLSQSQVGGEGSMQQQQAEQHEQQASRQHGTFSLEPQDDEDITLGVSEALQRLAHSNSAVDTFA